MKRKGRKVGAEQRLWRSWAEAAENKAPSMAMALDLLKAVELESAALQQAESVFVTSKRAGCYSKRGEASTAKTAVDSTSRERESRKVTSLVLLLSVDGPPQFLS